MVLTASVSVLVLALTATLLLLHVCMQNSGISRLSLRETTPAIDSACNVECQQLAVWYITIGCLILEANCSPYDDRLATVFFTETHCMF